LIISIVTTLATTYMLVSWT